MHQVARHRDFTSNPRRQQNLRGLLSTTYDSRMAPLLYSSCDIIGRPDSEVVPGSSRRPAGIRALPGRRRPGGAVLASVCHSRPVHFRQPEDYAPNSLPRTTAMLTG